VGNIRPGLRSAVLVSCATDPFLLLKHSMAQLKDHIRGHFSASMKERFHELITHAADMPAPLFPRGPGPSFVDFLGWCTWDSFYTDLSAARVLQGLESFKKTNVRPGFLILDDGWQSTDVDDRMNGFQWGGRLRSFLANFKFAPDYSAEVDDAAVLKSCDAGGSSGSAAADVLSPPPLSRSRVPEGMIPGSVGLADRDVGHSLRPLVERAHDEFGVKHLMVWHTLSGYWAGVATDSPEMSAFGPQLEFPSLPYPESLQRMSRVNALISEPFTTGGVGVVSRDRLEAFFSAYHATLKAMGVSGVKVDAQSVLPVLTGKLENRTGGWELTLAAHAALQASLAASFGRSNRALLPDEFPVVHCMCHSLHTLLSVASLYPDQSDVTGITGKVTAVGGAARMRPVVRGSDDYWPKDAASHGPHLYANTMNALLLSHIGLQDWDMFRTDGGRTSHMHAAARAISGGPVYISDVPQAHDEVILRKLAFADGAVPRCLRNALPLRRSLFSDPQREAGVPLLMQNSNADGGGVVGAFSIAGSVLEDDKDCFRHLSSAEVIWPTDKETEFADKTFAREGKPIYDESDPNSPNPYLEALAVYTWAAPIDVEELRFEASQKANAGGARFVALRHSDQSLHLCSSVLCQVPIRLQKVFDFDIVTFAQLRRLTLSGADDEEAWVGVIGAKDMYNAGGAVISAVAKPSSVETKLLGSGAFWVVVVQPSDAVPIDATVRAKSLMAPSEEEAFVDLEEAWSGEGVGVGLGSGIPVGDASDGVLVTQSSVERRGPVPWLGPAGGDGRQSRELAKLTLLEIRVSPIVLSAGEIQRTTLDIHFSRNSTK